MADYTTELRTILESYMKETRHVGLQNVMSVITTTRPMLFDFDYPIFDAAYKPALECKIMRHYYMREIGAETVALFKLYLEDKMNEIMPYYNQLYKSSLLEFNPFYDVDLTRDKLDKNNSEGKRKTDENSETDMTGKVTGNEVGNVDTNASETGSTHGDSSATSKTTSNGTNDGKQLFSDTPQGNVNISNDETYLTNVTRNTGTVTDTVSGSSTDTTNQTSSKNTTGNTASRNDTVTDTSSRTVSERGQNEAYSSANINDYLEHVKGKQGTASYSKMLNEYRDTFLNIDKLVIDELEECFMKIW